MTQLTPFERFNLPFQPYAFSFSSIFTKELHLAVASFHKSSSNQINIFRLEEKRFILETEIPTRFPQTRVVFCPHGTLTPVDSFISCDIKINHYRLENQQTTKAQEITVSEQNDPLSSIDWSNYDANLVATSCVDGTVSIIDINYGQILSKIQAHEQAIYDVSFCSNTTSFITAGLDGSLRIFDPRDLQSSLIFYQTAMPIQRAIASPFEGYLVAMLPKDSPKVVVVDTRKPGVPYSLIGSGEGDAAVSAFAWSKLSAARIFTVHEDLGIYHCDVVANQTMFSSSENNEDEGRNRSCGKASSRVQSMAVGPMTVAVATDRAIEFVEILESAPPLRTYH